LPPLVTFSPPGTPFLPATALNDPRRVVLFGNSNVNTDMRSGMRVTLGTWLDDDHTLGIEGSLFFLDPGRDRFAAASPGVSILGRPFTDATTGVPSAELVSLPGVIAGSVRVGTESTAWGGYLDGRYNLCCGCDYRIDALAGYRYFRASDALQINEDLTAINPLGIVQFGTRLQLQDRFKTDNDFNGGELGLAAEFRLERLYLGVRGTAALGNVRQTIAITGATVVTPPGGAPIPRVGGLLAQRTNIGSFGRDDFAVLPQVGVLIGYQLAEHIRAFVGYDYLYLSTVTRPGNVIDLSVNRTQVPPGTLVGPPRPAVQGAQTDYWLQGISGGVEVRY
jgi:hypothetical protein